MASDLMRKIRLEDHLGRKLSEGQFQFLVEAIGLEPGLGRDRLRLIADSYERGWEDGYAHAKFDWEGEPSG